MIDYNKIMRRIIIRTTAAPERYTPLPIAFSFFSIDLTSFRKAFFSEAFSLVLSIELISFNLSSRVLTSADSAGFGAAMGVVTGAFSAFDVNGENVNDKQATIKQKMIFFMLIDF